MNRHQPDQKAGTTPGGNPTGAARFTLAQCPKHRGWVSSTDMTRNRYQELLTKNPANIMVIRSKRPENQFGALER